MLSQGTQRLLNKYSKNKGQNDVKIEILKNQIISEENSENENFENLPTKSSKFELP